MLPKLQVKKGEIKFSTKDGDVQQFGTEDTEYARGKYMISKLRNPNELSEQKTFVEFYEHSPQNLHSLRMMHSLRHENILRCFEYETVVIENSKYYKASLHEFSGTLINILEKKFEILCYEHYFPSVTLAKLMR
jgi:hypothetical protein